MLSRVYQIDFVGFTAGCGRGACYIDGFQASESLYRKDEGTRKLRGSYVTTSGNLKHSVVQGKLPLGIPGFQQEILALHAR